MRGTRRVSGTGRGRGEVGGTGGGRREVGGTGGGREKGLGITQKGTIMAMAEPLLQCRSPFLCWAGHFGHSLHQQAYSWGLHFYCLDSMAFSQGNGLNDCVY